MNKIIARKRWFFLFSLLVTIPGLLFIIATPLSGGAVGLKFSVDYTGGTVWEFKLEQPADALVVRDVVAAAGHPEAQVTEAGSGFLIMRTKPLDLQSGRATRRNQLALSSLLSARRLRARWDRLQRLAHSPRLVPSLAKT
jgi:preprotein translocase subunit SecF